MLLIVFAVEDLLVFASLCSTLFMCMCSLKAENAKVPNDDYVLNVVTLKSNNFNFRNVG